MPKYLIIGSHGTLGSLFKQQLPQAETLSVDRDKLDITDSEQVTKFLTKHKPVYIINCAAYTNVDGAEHDYDSALRLNARVLETLSQSCNAIGATLVHFSTGMVFPGDNPDGYDENAPTSPVNKYGESKLAGEKTILQTAEKYFIVRTEWLYGKPQSAEAKKSFVELMIELGKSGKVKGVVDEIGRPTWSKDLAKATISLLESGNPYGIYHLMNEGQTSRLDWAKEIYKLQNMTVEIESVSGSSFPRPAKRPEFELLNNTKLPKLRTWQEALKEYLQS